MMLETRDDLLSIVVLEAGAQWPAWLTEYQRLAPNAVVIAQARTEGADKFRSRVIHRIEEAISSGGARVRVGVLISTSGADQDRLGLREGVSRALLKAMGSGQEAELVLAGDAAEGDPSRHELFALAGALCEELGGTSVNVRVRFAGKSGVMRAVSPSSPDAEPVVSKGGA